MPRSKHSFLRFTKGEWDPLLDGRADLDAYTASAERMENVFVLPQGGFTRRPGLLYRDTVRGAIVPFPGGSITATDPDGNNVNSGVELPYLTNGSTTDNNYYTTTVAIGVTNDYVVFEYDLGAFLDVAFIDLYKVALTTGSSTEFIVQKSDNGIAWTDLSTPQETQHIISLDTIERNFRLAVDDNIRYLRLVRVGTTNLGAAVIKLIEANVYTDPFTASESRLERFQFNDQFSYALLFTDENLAIYKDGLLQANVVSPYVSSQLSKINYTQNNTIAIYCHEDVAPYQLQRQGGDNLWSFDLITFLNVTQYNYTPTTTSAANNATLGATSGVTTLTGNAADIALMAVGDHIVGNGGEARVIKLVSATVVNIMVINPFISTGLVAADGWTVEGGYEDLWSSTRGYPRCATFYRGRLLLGGFKSRPQTIACSKIDDIYNYDEGQFRDDDAFTITLDSDQSNTIYHMVPHDDLEIYTSAAEFTIKTDQAFTATGTVRSTLQSRQGSMQEIRPEDIEDGGTLYVQKGGYSVQEFVQTDSGLSYTNNRLSLTASHLIDDPIDASLRKNTSFDESDLYLQVNENGELVVATIFKSQQVLAFTRNITDGNFKNIIAVGENMYAVVQRNINGNIVRYFEELNRDRTTDCAIFMLVGDARIDGLQYPRASITPSDPQGNGGTVANLTDGDPLTLDTNTVAIGATNGYVAWQLDLGSNQNIDFIRLQNIFLGITFTDEFKIQTSTDNFATDITTSTDTFEITFISKTIDVNIGATKRYVRLIRIGTTNLGLDVLSTGETEIFLSKTVTVSGLDILEQETVWTIIDGSVYGPTVVNAGSVTLPVDVIENLEIGLDFDTLVTTNEVEDFASLGSLMGNKKSISEIIVNVNETQEILVEGYNPFVQTLSQFSLNSTIDSPPGSFTGRYRMVGFRGWNELGKISISQTNPRTMTLLNIAIYFNYGK